MRLEEFAGVVLTLSDLLALVGVPGARLVDDAVYRAQVDQFAELADAARIGIISPVALEAVKVTGVNGVVALRYYRFASIVAIIAIFYVVVNFIVDLLYTVLDPRIRHAGT